ncbi:MAG: hypothetical protein MZU84_01250 [Sphingobacterium sp.]|nr:hypothetical protein [Sphingobacterium sp.]
MAVPVKRVEREFLLRAARDALLELFLSAGGAEWSVRITEVRDKFVVFRCAPIRLLAKGASLDFTFLQPADRRLPRPGEGKPGEPAGHRDAGYGVEESQPPVPEDDPAGGARRLLLIQGRAVQLLLLPGLRSCGGTSGQPGFRAQGHPQAHAGVLPQGGQDRAGPGGDHVQIPGPPRGSRRNCLPGTGGSTTSPPRSAAPSWTPTRPSAS